MKNLLASSLRGAHNQDDPNELVQNQTVDFNGQPANKAYSGGWRACSFILVNEYFDRLAYFAIVTNLVTYLSTELGEATAAASKNVNNWSGSLYFTSLLGAFIADAYLGRFRTIILFSSAYLVGLTTLTLSVSIDKLKPPKCDSKSLTCPHPTSGQIGLFFFAIYLAGVGSGGSKPCASAFGGDQFDETDKKELKRKASFFNWWLFFLSCANVTATMGIVLIQNNVGWGWGYGIPTVGMAVAIVSFVSGARYYRYTRPTGSPFTQVARVLVAAIRNRKYRRPSDIRTLYEGKDEDFSKPRRRRLPHSEQFKFLDKASIREPSSGDGQSELQLSRWRICSVTEVEEVKQIARIMPIWLTMLPFSMVFAQTNTLFVKQGGTMDRRIGSTGATIPAASLHVFTSVPNLLFIPFYDRVIVPFVAKLSGHHRGVSLLQRLGIGLFLASMTMVAAASTERLRLQVVESHDLFNKPKVPVPLSIFRLIPQYAIFGIAEVFGTIGQLEFFYDQAPDGLQSMGSALFLSNLGAGNFLSSLLITIVNRATEKNGVWIARNLNKSHLDRFYWLLAIMCFVEIFIYAAVASWYSYKSAGVHAESIVISNDEEKA